MLKLKILQNIHMIIRDRYMEVLRVALPKGTLNFALFRQAIERGKALHRLGYLHLHSTVVNRSRFIAANLRVSGLDLNTRLHNSRIQELLLVGLIITNTFGILVNIHINATNIGVHIGGILGESLSRGEDVLGEFVSNRLDGGY